MAYIIIGFVLLLIIAPIIAILPSARQKALMAKRREAMAENIRIDLTQIEDPDPNPEDYISNTGKPLDRKCPVAAYRIPRPRSGNWRQLPSIDWSVNRVNAESDEDPVKGWRWDGRLDKKISNDLNEFIVLNLAALPDDVMRVEEKKFLISVYWKEAGEVQETIDFLTGCAETNIVPVATDDPPNTDLP
ncbi:MAG: hypothetical protein ABGY96_10720 [bacterium]|nr:hypothetical protein [Gammaproteobacteria bacterium]HIL99109.1 hypothetical protein [Pseudomonadales bacterium]